MIKQFIKDNKLSFAPGCRNSTLTILIGYAQHLGFTSEEALKTELKSQCDNDPFIESEIDRLWGYCNGKNYKNFWSTPIAKKQYIF